MSVSHLEKRILNYLTINGAATKFEIKQALGSSKGGVQNVVSSLIAKGSIQPTGGRKKHNSNRNHKIYGLRTVTPVPTPVAAPAIAPVAAPVTPPPVDGIDHSSLYVRVQNLEAFRNAANLTRLNETVEGLTKDIKTLQEAVRALREGASIASARLSHTFRCTQGHAELLDALDKRIGALEPEPTVDPAYVAIEKDMRERLGDTFPEERVRELIDEAYALSKK